MAALADKLRTIMANRFVPPQHRENISRERASATRRAVTEAVDGVPNLVALRSANIDERGLNSFQNEDNEWVSYWRAGMTVGSAPIKPID
jgi:hypothetical protein